ncbi:MAG: acriflavin resistance protein [Proteobacteria bacterium]|nr:MAG: acriflavin resistance protein [Pseudomonadota bacterium]
MSLERSGSPRSDEASSSTGAESSAGGGGPVRYMAKNPVAANLLMLFFLVGGAFTATKVVKTEVFPEVELDRVLVTVTYPGAAPAEVEQGIVRPVEEAVNGLDNVRRVIGFANESAGGVLIEIIDGANLDEVLSDVKSAVDRIVTFPQDAERPVVQKLSNRREVMMVVVYGELNQRELRQQTEAVRDGLLARPDITQAELLGVAPYEIAIEVSEETLQRYSLTLDAVAARVRAASLDLPAGALKTSSGEILLRTKERRYTARGYENIVIVNRPDGTLVHLRDIAKVRDTFQDIDLAANYDGFPAGLVQVFRVGDQSPAEVSTAVRAYLERRRAELPPGVKLGVWFDRSEFLQARLHLLYKNALLGLILVVVALGLFLELKLAYWVTMGIPISVLGAFIAMPMGGVTINMISLFAFILVLGIVVDDAIVVGENVYYHRSVQKNYLEAAVVGAIEVGRPVTFSVLTTVAAFAPLLFITGVMGKFMWSIPVIVIAVLLVSLVESIFVLPAHLSGGRKGTLPTAERPKRAPGPVARFQAHIAHALAWFIRKPYLGTLKIALKFRYATLMLGLASLVVTGALFAGGYVKMIFFPKVESDLVRARLVMPYGTPIAVTNKYIQHMIEAAKATVREVESREGGNKSKSGSILRNVASITGSGLGGGGPVQRGGSSGSHLGEVAVYLVDSSERGVDSATFARLWRQKVGEIAGAEELDFQSTLTNFGADIGIQLAHADFEVLKRASARLKERLESYPGLYDIADSFEVGKRELQLAIKPEARSLGLTTTDLARQVRGAFYGAEALRLQRGRNEVKVMVRYPEKERRCLANIASLRIRTPRGAEVPFAQAAAVVEGRGYARINRTDRKRMVNVVSKAYPKQANPNEIMADLRANFLPKLLADFPGLTYDLEGEQRERAESIGSLRWGLLAALGLIYALLAIPFHSYSQPLIIMSAIPFGMIGAVIGHALLGFDISMMSLFGIVALTGVVVNDSLVLVDFVNRNRKPGRPVVEAVLEGCARRFRPIMLTTLTTFFALVPMLAETSVQAQFLVPMAISLAFGVLFATAITLVLIPTLYVLLEDAKNLGRWLIGRPRISVLHTPEQAATLKRDAVDQPSSQ